jgi:hypothetical protein
MSSSGLPSEILALATLVEDDGSYPISTEEAYEHVLKHLLSIADFSAHPITYAISQQGIDPDLGQIFLHTEEQLSLLKYKDPDSSSKAASTPLLTGHVTKIVMLRKFFFFTYRVSGSTSPNLTTINGVSMKSTVP